MAKQQPVHLDTKLAIPGPSCLTVDCDSAHAGARKIWRIQKATFLSCLFSVRTLKRDQSEGGREGAGGGGGSWGEGRKMRGRPYVCVCVSRPFCSEPEVGSSSVPPHLSRKHEPGFLPRPESPGAEAKERSSQGRA